MKTLKKFTPGRGYTKEDWDAVDSPKTAEEMAQARPFAEVFPELPTKMRKNRHREVQGDRSGLAVAHERRAEACQGLTAGEFARPSLA